MKIGFIGLGNMGGPMAANLAAAGYDVVGFDAVRVTIPGVERAESSVEVAKAAEVVVTMLPNGHILRNVVAEILPSMGSGTTIVDCSTVDIESARNVASLASQSGVMSFDAPVSGGVGGASAGTLTFMVGGPETQFPQILPILEIMGEKVVYCGTTGAGLTAKICNNMILGVTMIATSEAFALADKLGLARNKVFEVVSTSSGSNWSMNTYCPAPGVGPQSPSDNEYTPGFASELMLKDLKFSQEAAEGVHVDTPMGQLAERLYDQFVNVGSGQGKDFSGILPWLELRTRSYK